MNITDDILHAFVDGQLNPKESEQVEAYLNANPDKAQEIADWQLQNEAINALYPAPEAIAPLPLAANRNRAPFGAIAASVAALAVGLGIGWFSRGSLERDNTITAELIGDAITAHAVYAADPHRPVEIGASEEELLLRWLSNRVGRPLTAPNLSDQGYQLVGGRLLSVSEGPAAQFMYENDDGVRVTLFAIRAETSTLASFTYQETDEGNGFYWEDETLRYAIVGDISRDTLNALAVQVYDQLS
ncbi:anti-sigma factor family protein [Cochlodiniinecator piscidefendens]|uniref:anti-sigma factor family protein n=1 Tax=Cochlodiniinecator piscidefendens TaxID=2715756 RepID=UPI0014091D65|nr:anti-sigma factor [Cochlodiniinecator piscidefendens]